MYFITLKDCPRVSTNKIYESRHWAYRNKMKEMFKLWFKSQDLKSIPCWQNRVVLHFLFTFRVRPLDSSNCSYMGKMIEDLLVESGKIPNDTINHVEAVSYSSVQNKKQKEELNVILKIEEHKETI